MFYTRFYKPYLLILLLCVFQNTTGQTTVKGRVIDADTNQNIVNAIVSIKETKISTTTNNFGVFSFKQTTLPLGEQTLIVASKGYTTKKFPIIINNQEVLDLKKIYLEYSINQDHTQIGTISLTDTELDDENDVAFNPSGLLQANRDVFLNAAAFDFSATFFRPRGLNNENSKVLINGVLMNKLYDGKPQWNNWGGLNDVQRTRELSFGISENEYAFGDLLGASNIIMRASKYRKGIQISHASSNRSYQGRTMFTYNSGLTTRNWAFSASLSYRYGQKGFIDGTGYEAPSFFGSIEKKINDHHSLNITGFYTPNRRGRSTAITKEVFDIKGATYNPNWGYQNGKIRNSRERLVEEPILMLNHFWEINKNTSLNSNLAFQTGKIANSRIDTGGSGPSKTY